jgi:DNA-binding transcriptional regulator LsrR (DeoR family)
MIMDEEYRRGFGQRLKTKIGNRNYAELAKAIGVGGRSTIGNWVGGRNLPNWNEFIALCTTLECSADFLLGIEPTAAKEDNAAHEVEAQRTFNLDGTLWHLRYPDWLDPHHKQYKEIARGVRAFEAFVVEGRDAEDVFAALSISTEDAAKAVQAAFRSGTITLNYVQRDEALEQQIKRKFKLKRVLVASVPSLHDGTIIRAELVAFLAATNALSRVANPKVIGFGSGYTILRMAELSVPSYSQFRNTDWLPLMAFPDGNFSHLAANAIVRMMAQRHPGSTALTMPFARTDKDAEVQPLLIRYANADAIFMTANGLGRKKSRKGVERELFNEFRSADYSFPLNDLERLFEMLKMTGVEDRFAGEVVGLMLDENGAPLPEIETDNRQFVFPNNLSYLKKAAQDRFVWLVAARLYKAEAVYMAVQNGLANALVIDSEIATYLIER